MAEAELPPPYSLADEQHPDSTPQSSLHLKPSASAPRLRPSPDSTSQPNPHLRPSVSFSLRQNPDPGLHPGPSPSSNAPLPSPAPANDGPSSTLPPSYLDLTMFSIGTRKIKKSLVSLEQIKSHLRLLRAFKLFQEKVEDPYSDPAVADVVPPIGRSIGVKGRWLWFLEMAVERFRRWLLLLATAEGFFVTPPVDVWLIWHAYMLNPGWYKEDCERSWFLRPLRDLEEHPMSLAASMGDNILNHRPAGDQEGLWEAGTHLAFDPFVSSATLTDLDVECPRCERTINTSFVNTEGTGFAQPEFVTVCPYCDTLVTRESLGVAKFIRDIVLDPKDSSHVQMHGKGVYLPGSLLLHSGALDTNGARITKDSLRYLHVFRNDDDSGASKLPYQSIDSWKKAIGERLRYSGVELRKNADKAGLGILKIRRIMGAYVDEKPFSVELVASAMRQSTFTDKIHQLGWLDPGFLGDPESARVLQHCVLRYYGFLTLIRTLPDFGAFFVPTLDIDLVWHTHQLAPANYSKDCLSIFWRLVDHNDQVEESNLADGLDMTSKAWQTQFGVPYMYCGCPLQEATVGERLARAFLFNRDRMEPPMNRDDCYSATHPSEHNSVHIIGRSERRRNAREIEWRKRREKEGKKIGKGKGKSKNAELEERYLRGRSHDFPFLMRVPKTHGYGCPHVQKAYAAGCAVGVSGLAKG